MMSPLPPVIVAREKPAIFPGVYLRKRYTLRVAVHKKRHLNHPRVTPAGEDAATIIKMKYPGAFLFLGGGIQGEIWGDYSETRK